MKQLSALLFACLLFTATNIRAQQSDDGSVYTKPEMPAAGYKVADNGTLMLQNAVKPTPDENSNAAGRSVECSQLTAATNDNNGNAGIMFNVIARKDIIIKSIDNNFGYDSTTVRLYYKRGGANNFTLSSGAWTLLGSGFIQFKGTGVKRIPVFINQFLTTGDTMAFLIMVDKNKSVRYLNGTATGVLYTQDNSLKIFEGDGIFSDSSLINSPRVFNGNIGYCPFENPLCFTETICKDFGNGNNGEMFDIRATRDITLNRIGVSVGIGTQELFVYTRPNTYRNFELDSTKWTRLPSLSFTKTISNDSLVYYSLPTPLNINAGQSVAYYIGCVGLGSVYYTNTNDDAYPFIGTGLVDMYPGSGISGKFGVGNVFTNRMFNGTLDMCARFPVALGIEQHKNLQLSLYPNPTNDVLNITTDDHEAVSLDVIDMQGRVVMATVFQGATTLDVAQLPTSVYQLYLHNANGTAVKRFVKN